LKCRVWTSMPPSERKSPFCCWLRYNKYHLGHRDIPNFQGIVFRSRWQFNRKRGAVLLMHRPRMTHIPDEFFPASLHLPILKGKSVVSQVWDCPGFYMYLSNRCECSQPASFASPNK
jgi:hypothetical protein